jgi:hypothetical protein
MARILQLACARCGHQQMYVVESAESEDKIAETVRASGDREMTFEAVSAATRLRRLESLPTSLPVGGIITPV